MSNASERRSSLSVIITAYNEEALLPTTLATAVGALTGIVADYEIIITDDASRDGTARAADELARAHPHVRVVHNPKNLNQGGCYRVSIGLATKEYHCLLPGDDMIQLESLRRLFASTGQADMSLISIDNREIRHPVRRHLSNAFVGVLNLLFGYRLMYYNGPVIIKTGLLRSIEVSQTFMFVADSVIKLLDRGASFVVVPVHFNVSDKAANMRAIRRNLLPVVKHLARLYWCERIVTRLRPAENAGKRRQIPPR